MIDLIDWDLILMVAHEACARKAKSYKFDMQMSDDKEEARQAKYKYNDWCRRRDAAKQLRMKAPSPDSREFLSKIFGEDNA